MAPFCAGASRPRAGASCERDAAVGNARHAATSLDRLLIGPLISVVGDSPLVVVPTGPLHAVPWGSLPSLNGRPLVVSPSLSVWLDLTGRPRLHRRRTVLVSGPRLRHSAREVTAIAGLLPDSTVLRGRAATITSALAALDGAGLAHLACHGRFRADSPLFSSLEMADGPLNVYELQNLPPSAGGVRALGLRSRNLGSSSGRRIAGFCGGAARHGDPNDRRKCRAGPGRCGEPAHARLPPLRRSRPGARVRTRNSASRDGRCRSGIRVPWQRLTPSVGYSNTLR